MTSKSLLNLLGPSTYIASTEISGSSSSIPPGRRLIVPLHVCVQQGLRFVKARLLSMDIPARISENLPAPNKILEGSSNKEIPTTPTHQTDNSLMKIDPYKGSWGLRLLELELSNPTDVAFEVNVYVHLDKPKKPCNTVDTDEDLCCSRTRIDRDYSSRVLIPLEHFKLPVIDDSFFSKDHKVAGDDGSSILKQSKAELTASINNLISKIKVRWQSGRNSSGELNIKDAFQSALQSSVMDILLPDPLTFGFRLKSRVEEESSSKARLTKGAVFAHEMTGMEALIRNNTREMITMTLSITCRDIAGDNCIEGKKSTVLWSGMFFIFSLIHFPPCPSYCYYIYFCIAHQL